MEVFSNGLEKIHFNITLGNLNIKVLSLNKVLPDPEWYVPEHVHSDFEFHIIPEGKGYISIEGNDFEVHGGELYITGPMLRHKQLTDPETPMTEYCLECEITIVNHEINQEDFSYEEGIFLKEILSDLYPHAFKDFYRIASTFEEIFLEAKEQQAGFLLRLQNLIVKIVLDLSRTICNFENITYKYPCTENGMDANRILRLVKYIDANYTNNINIDDVSKVLLLSPRQINRLMLKTFHQTFHSYLLQYRMHVAERLLMNTTLPVEEVAYASGFSSHYYMYQVFKRRGKPAPGQLRKKKD